jgi:hypothetical protein
VESAGRDAGALLGVKSGGDVRVWLAEKDNCPAVARVRVSMIAERRGCYRVREALRRVQQRE